MQFTVGFSQTPLNYRQWVKSSGANGLPTKLIVDRNGLIASSGIGKSTREVVKQLVDGRFDLKTEAELHWTILLSHNVKRLGALLKSHDPTADDFAHQSFDGPCQNVPSTLCSLAETTLTETPKGTKPDLELAYEAASRACELRTDSSILWYDSVLAETEFQRANLGRAIMILKDAGKRAKGPDYASIQKRITELRQLAEQNKPD